MLELTPKQKYAKKLEHPKWQLKRLKIIERDEAACRLCGDNETMLHVHHLKYYGENPWDVKDEDLITYCKPCHEIVEDLKKAGFEDYPIEKMSKYRSADDPDNKRTLMSLILKHPEDGTYSCVFYNYLPTVKELEFKISVGTHVITDMASDIAEIKAKIQPSNA